MSGAARKARKRERLLAVEAAAEVSDTAEGRRAFVEAEAPAYQHPTRAGIPHRRSKAPNPTAPIDLVGNGIDHSRVNGFPDGGFR